MGGNHKKNVVWLITVTREVESAACPDQLSRYSDGLRPGRPGFDSWQEQVILLFSTASRPALGPTQPPIQWVPGIFAGGKVAGA
jgi:hypothetical protein